MSASTKWGRYAAAFALVPLAVGVEPVDRDTSYTTITFGIGSGSYADVTRGCEGQVITADRVPLADAGIGIEHERKGFVLGVRASGIGDELVAQGSGGGWVINPHFSHEGQGFGVGIGPILQSGMPDGPYGDEGIGEDVPPVSAHLRFGNRTRGTDFRVSLAENVPTLTPGGALELTQGFHASDVVGGRIGLSTPVPFDGFGLVVRLDVRPTDALGIELRGRLGQSAGVDESTIGAGLTYRIRHD